MPIQTAADSISNSQGSPFGFKNRIINGAMVIDQRNAGASVTPAGSANTYTLDRFAIYCSQSSKLTVQQSTTAPVGFANSYLVTSSSAYSVTSSDEFNITQPIEAFNFSDMAWGTANAQTITLSFWVRSSLTGTFGGALRNASINRNYPFSYTISTANTFEYKTITIAGDTSGTWAGATNGIAVYVGFSVGAGSSASGTAGAWAAGNIISATGATSVVGTNGATFYITGVQLEKGSQATAFDYRPYSTELELCQRYCHVFRPDATSTFSNIGWSTAFSGDQHGIGLTMPAVMRVQPTITYSSLSHLAVHMPGVIRSAITSLGVNTSQSNNFRVVLSGVTDSNGNYVNHKAIHFEFNGTSTGFLAFSAEL